MKEGVGDSKLFFAELMVIVGAIFLSGYLINIFKNYLEWFLLIGILLIVIGSAWKSRR